jgi:hypothetical protein
MSKGVKIVLIVGGILAFLSIACVGGFAFLGYYFVDHEGVIKSDKEGTEFGKTTDNSGCQTKVLSMIKTVRDTELNEILKAEYFFDSCLQTSRPTPNFCDGLPSDWTDIMNDDKAKEAECAKLGFRNSNACRQVMKKKLDFCDKKR